MRSSILARIPGFRQRIIPEPSFPSQGSQARGTRLDIRRGHQSRTQSNACARARMALALGKLNFSCVVIGLTCMPTKPEPLNLGVPVVNFPRANAILARAQALLWVRD